MDGEIVVRGDGMTAVAPGVRVGIMDIAGHDFGDGAGAVPAASLVFDHPDATSRMEWLRAGSSCHAGEHRFTVVAVEGTGRLSGSVTLAPL